MHLTWTGSTVALFHESGSPGTSPGDQVPGIGPNITVESNGGRLDLFHYAPLKARYSLARVLALLRGQSELKGGTIDSSMVN